MARERNYIVVLVLAFALAIYARETDLKNIQPQVAPEKIELDSAAVFFSSTKPIHGITFDHHGLMYVGGGLEVFTIAPDKTVQHFITLADKSPNTIIWSMVFGLDGNLYLAAHDRIVQVTPEKKQHVLICEDFSGPCGVTDLRFDKNGNLYVVYDNVVAKYDATLKKSIVIDGAKFPTPIQWAVGIEFSRDENFLYIGDCRGCKLYIVPITEADFMHQAAMYPTNFGQYLTKDQRGNVYLTAIGSFATIPELIMFKSDFARFDIYCKIKPPQNDNAFKKAIAFGDVGFDEKAVYCIIGNSVYAYHFD